MAEIITLPTETKEDIKEVIDTRPKTLDKLIIKANDIALNSSDYMVRRANTSNVRFNESAGLTFIAEDQEIRDFQISRYALGQLGSKIGVPARYLEKCVQSGRGLMVDISCNTAAHIGRINRPLVYAILDLKAGICAI